jgi:hypothetical protein
MQRIGERKSLPVLDIEDALHRRHTAIPGFPPSREGCRSNLRKQRNHIDINNL